MEVVLFFAASYFALPIADPAINAGKSNDVIQ
jgi:hypothetical protein